MIGKKEKNNVNDQCTCGDTARDRPNNGTTWEGLCETKKEAVRPLPTSTFFMHISEARGTTICKLARANGERTNLIDNCNQHSDLTVDWVAGPRRSQINAAREMFTP